MRKKFFWSIVAVALTCASAPSGIGLYRAYQRLEFYRRAYYNTTQILYSGMSFPFGRTHPGRLCHMTGGASGWILLRALQELRFASYLSNSPRLAGALVWKSAIPDEGTNVAALWVGRVKFPAVLKVSRPDGAGAVTLPIHARNVLALFPAPITWSTRFRSTQGRSHGSWRQALPTRRRHQI